MVLKKEQIRLESIATKTAFSAMKLFVSRPYLLFSLSDISKQAGISKSNTAQAIAALIHAGIVRQARGGKRKLFKANAGSRLTAAFSDAFMQERIAGIRPQVRNAVEYLLSKLDGDIDALILFGSCAYGLETAKSDIDVLVIADKDVKVGAVDFFPYRFEVVVKKWADVEKPNDFVALEALMNGVFFKGNSELFRIKAGLEGFPKDYLLFRLKKAKEYAARIKSLRGDARRYYEELLEITLGELESLLYRGKLVPKKEIKVQRDISELEDKISGEGSIIWLTGT